MDIVGTQQQLAREHLDAIVLEFGIDRGMRYLAQAGSAVLFTCVAFLMFSNPTVSCFPIANQAGLKSIPTSFTKYVDAYCWEQEDPTNGKQTNLPMIDLEVYDPRTIMDNFVVVLIVQLIMLSVPIFYWNGAVGGVILGHVKYMQQLIAEVAQSFRVGLEKVSLDENLDAYDKNGLVIRSTFTLSDVCQMIIFPIYYLFDCCRRTRSRSYQPPTTTSETTNLTNTPSDSNRVEKSLPRAPLTDLTMLNLIFYENIAHLSDYPYVKAIMKLYKAEPQLVNLEPINFCGIDLCCIKPESTTEKKPSQNEKKPLSRMDNSADCHQLKAILQMWCHEDNLSRRILVNQYLVKHVLAIVMAALSIVFMMAKSGWSWPVDLDEATFYCNLVAHEMDASCVFMGYEEFALLWKVNFFMLICLIWLAIYALFKIHTTRLDHESAYFIRFLQPQKTIIWETIQATLDQKKETPMHKVELVKEQVVETKSTTEYTEQRFTSPPQNKELFSGDQVARQRQGDRVQSQQPIVVPKRQALF